LIADDAAPIRAIKRQILAKAPEVEVVGEAADATEAIRLAEALRPHLIVMDLRMPGDGPTATKHIRKVHPVAKILAVTAFADKGVVEALKGQYQVDALLSKDQIVHELIPTI
jgi:DNA-binding NarL/FixJ family response regulator